MTAAFTESIVEQAALAWFESMGWSVKHGAEIAPGEPGAERDEYGQVVLAQRLRDALARLNSDLPAEALDDAFRKLTRPEGADLLARNRAVHRLLVDGVTVEYRTADGEIRGAQAHVGALAAGREWFKPWRTISGKDLAAAHLVELQVVIEGVLSHRRLLDLVRDFIVFEDDGSRLVKKIAGYHQFHAVQVAVGETLRAAEMRREAEGVAEERGRYEAGGKPGGKPGDRRVGVVWHTQGSGKSLTMAFYAGRIIREPAMQNPTIVVLTDRNDLDDQLFGTFSRCKELLRQPPMRRILREVRA